MNQNHNRGPIWHALGTLLVVAVILIVYAYGFQVTQVNLEKPKEARRQAQLTNIIRGLAQPRLFQYEQKRLEIDAPILMPCSSDEPLPPVDTSGRYITVTPDCVPLGGEVTVKGSNFEPGETVYLYFIPEAPSVQEQIELKLADDPIQVNSQGEFSYTTTMRKDRPSDQLQYVRAVVIQRSGLPQASQTLNDTINKIIETVFLALIATTLGTALAIPISFMAARNLMSDVVSPFGSIMSGLLLAPVGWLVGSNLFRLLKNGASGLAQNAGVGVIALLLSLGILWLLTRLLAQEYQGRFAAWRQRLLGLALVLLAIVALGLLGTLGISFGPWLQNKLGPFGFLGNFIFVISDLITIVLPLLGGLGGLFLFGSLASSLSGRFLRTAMPAVAKVFTVIVSTLTGAMLVAILAAGIAWLYEIDSVVEFVGLPALVAGGAMLAVSLLFDVERPVPTGMIIYNITRTLLNALRSIEPLIMVVAFAVWVGIGPFAGVMALALHTIAGLGKLYSEQVENILSGPIEAVTATGANRLQTIAYAVIPQIVPPYLAFTLYRWDINVRMSTIIGFGGGGGIGFLVQQNLNLLKYRDASVQMIAIAIVVASLDYMSARVRERII
jgi:ABC-type phosphate/phosphonate transport system permease subunit